jgi:glycosyltransferase involved in cell wall biosynthesis
LEYSKQLSVIITVYNTEKYLRRCLESAICALPDNSEILIINDGSPDNSEAIILEFVNKYPSEIKYIKKENSGLADTKNFALSRTEGEFIAFFDSDDYVDKQIYSKLLYAAKAQDVLISICDIELVYEDGRPSFLAICRNEYREGAFFQAVDTPLMAASCNMVVHKSLYDGLLFPVGLNNEDIAVTPILYRRAKNIAFVQEPLYKYYQRTESIQSGMFGEHRFVIIDTTRLCIERLNEADTEDCDIIKGSIYSHQILALALYPVRNLPFTKRYKILRAYINKARNLLPDLFTNRYVYEIINGGSSMLRAYKKTAMFFMEHKLYFFTCVVMSIANIKKRSHW